MVIFTKIQPFTWLRVGIATIMDGKLIKFRNILKESNYVVLLSGAGTSAESGIPTFRGNDGCWHQYRATELATPEAFATNPSLVWNFYHYRRELVLSKEPNAAHYAISECQKQLQKQGKQMIIITQNIDGLHQKAGSENVIELHGSLFKTQCTKCYGIQLNYNSPICESLKQYNLEVKTNIPIENLPSCHKCNGLLRPHVVWFGENINAEILESIYNHLENCDLCLVVGTSSVVYPAAMFGPLVASRGIPVAEFNIEEKPASTLFQFHFSGLCGSTLPIALSFN